jgi:hypothetical protein
MGADVRARVGGRATFVEHVSGVQGIQAVMDALTSLGLQDKVTFATLNVFACNLNGISKVESRAGDTGHSAALLGMNGAIALTATTADRNLFIQAVWDVAIPTGQFRYADGMLYMLSLLVLSGNFRMY